MTLFEYFQIYCSFFFAEILLCAEISVLSLILHTGKLRGVIYTVENKLIRRLTNKGLSSSFIVEHLETSSFCSHVAHTQYTYSILYTV